MNEITIKDIKQSISPENKHRVSALVCDDLVWFESDHKLAASPEAFLSAYLIPSMACGKDLSYGGKICPIWERNVEGLINTINSWWGFRKISITSNGSMENMKKSSTAAFFSGGLDSFFTLVKNIETIDYLIFVRGFDIPLSEYRRFEQALAWIRKVSEKTNKPLILVETNLREHPLFSSISWELTFGSALSAVGHLLSEEIGHVIIPSSFSVDEERPWGSHSKIEPNYSSGAVDFILHDVNYTRLQKTMELNDSPMVHKYLRVCWENKDDQLNCGKCEKCIRTQLYLYICGSLGKAECFPDRPLSRVIDKLPGIPEHLNVYYTDVIEKIDDPEIQQSLRRLLKRSPYWRVYKRLVGAPRETLRIIRDTVLGR